MKKLILLLIFIPIVFSCSEKSLEGDNSKKFREIYNETFWNGSNFRVSFETSTRQLPSTFKSSAKTWACWPFSGTQVLMSEKKAFHKVGPSTVPW